jgi:hypothetical protein
MLKNNVGTADRLLRAVIGLALLLVYILPPHSLWGLVGIILLATAAFGTCPLYTVFGFSTRSIRKFGR